MEPIQGEGGINVAAPQYLSAVRKLCDERDILLIFDEVQTGMGRTGEWFGYQHYDIVPDIMTLAKALGGGVAIGAMCARPDLAEYLKPGLHASTFGGNPIACAAGVAVFAAIEEENLLENCREMGKYIRARLGDLEEKFPAIIKEVRGKGLMLGVECFAPAGDIFKRCLEKGLRINCTHDTVLRLMPPMTIGREEADAGLDILEEVMAGEARTT
jgi:acetylornithine/succinyldiaminopimelate/putrescine aminotransferase